MTHGPTTRRYVIVGDAIFLSIVEVGLFAIGGVEAIPVMLIFLWIFGLAALVMGWEP